VPAQGDDSCPCGSGLSFAECHGAARAAPVVRLRTPPKPDVRERSRARVQRLTTPGRKKLVLAYPPYSTVTAPPLGVAYLKGYVQRTLPDWSVTVLDLNVRAHAEVFEGLRRGPMLPASFFPEGRAGELELVRASETFRGEHDDEFYGDAERVVHYSRLWSRALRGVLHQPTRDQRAFEGRAAMPVEIERHADRLLAEAPDAIGISICYNEQYWSGLCLALALRKRAPELPLLLGGTMFKEGIAREWAPREWPVDYVVSGAGELPLVEILAGRADAGAVPGVTVVEGAELRTTPPFYDTDFEAVGAPDFSDFEPRAYYAPRPVFPMQTTRGCYWKRCTFCNHYRTVGGSYQLRSMSGLIAEMSRHVAAGVRHFTFVDDIISPARFNAMSKAILEAGLSVRYYAMSRPMKHFTREILQRMYDAGCRFVLWGVESGSQRVLDAMEKGTVVAEVERCLELSAEVGIKNHVFVICGFPTETREEFGETLDFLRRARPSIHCVHKTMFGLERGTPVFDHPERFQIERMRPKTTPLLYDFDCGAGMTRGEAQEALDDARPFFRSFAAGKELEKGDFRMRDHMLLSYSRDLRAEADDAARGEAAHPSP
jgi:anaerobic magnesium-protoporphyrin IX monomethyl ester cyclase